MPMLSVERHLAGASVAAVIMAGCSTRLEDLRQPTLVWDRSQAHCTSMTAVDASGGLWTAHGCEGDGEFAFDKVRTVTPEQLAAVTAAVDALPPLTDGTCSPGYRHRFFRLGEPPVNVSACGGRSPAEDL